MTDDLTVEERLERLTELERTRADESRNLTLLLGGVIVIVLSYVLCF